MKKEHREILFSLGPSPRTDWDCCHGDEDFTRNLSGLVLRRLLVLIAAYFSDRILVTQSCTALPAVERAHHLKAINLWLDSFPQKGCAWNSMTRCGSDPVPLPEPLVLSFGNCQEENGSPSPEPEGKSY